MNEREIHYTVAPEVFAQFPGYVRGVVVAQGLTNGESPPELQSLLRDAEASLRQRIDTEGLTAHPSVVSWRAAYKAFGAKPAKFRPSMEAMARRVLKDEQIPSISTLVDIGNVVSLRYLLPAGGHATDEVTGDIALRAATGSEEFVPFGSDQMENPAPGEIIFVEGNTVLTRRWTWRQGRHTLMVPSTKSVEFNVDGLPPAPLSDVEQACRDIMELMGRFCGGTSRYELLSETNPKIRIR